MATITIQFDGMCCHIKPPAGSLINPERRCVLPNVHDHIPYIEVYTTDVDTAANPDFQFIKYTRENASYQRVELRDVKIELLSITLQSFATTTSFNQRVPSLTAVEPRFTGVNPGFLQPTIPTGQAAAYFDIRAGVLSSGPSEYFRTVFEPPNSWPVRHLGQWAQLEVEVNGSAPVLRVTDLGPNGVVRDLQLKDGADLVTIGNQTLDDILGQPNMIGHFIHYYDFAASPILPPLPEPKKQQGLGVGCSNTQWP